MKKISLSIIIAFCLIATMFQFHYPALSENLNASDTTFSEVNQRIMMDTNEYKELTTDEMWKKMQIQVYVNKMSGECLIWDGKKFLSAIGTINPYENFEQFWVCDVDKDGEFELLFITDLGSGTRTQLLWCYSKTREINCVFGMNNQFVQDSYAIEKDAEGTANLAFYSGEKAGLDIVQTNQGYALNVSLPENLSESLKNEIARVATLREMKKKTLVLPISDSLHPLMLTQEILSVIPDPVKGEVTVNLSRSMQNGEVLIVAFYENGKLLSIETETIVQNENITVITDKLTKADTIKVILWGGLDTMQTLCPMKKVYTIKNNLNSN